MKNTKYLISNRLQMITGCRFWKYTVTGEHAGYCELNRGTPLNDGEVIGQQNVKLMNNHDGRGSYCSFPPNNEGVNKQKLDVNLYTYQQKQYLKISAFLDI